MSRCPQCRMADGHKMDCTDPSRSAPSPQPEMPVPELMEYERELYPHLCVAPWGANAVRNTWGPCVGDEAREACQVWAINQSLETLSRQMFRATALMNPHLAEFAEK